MCIRDRFFIFLGLTTEARCIQSLKDRLQSVENHLAEVRTECYDEDVKDIKKDVNEVECAKKTIRYLTDRLDMNGIATTTSLSDSELSDFYSLRGTSYVTTGEYQKAIDDLSISIDLNKKLPTLDAKQKKHQYMSIVSRASSYYYLGDFDKAIRDCTYVIEIDKEKQLPEAYWFRSRAYLSQGDTQKEHDDLEALFSIYPSFIQEAMQWQEKLG